MMPAGQWPVGGGDLPPLTRPSREQAGCFAFPIISADVVFLTGIDKSLICHCSRGDRNRLLPLSATGGEKKG